MSGTLHGRTTTQNANIFAVLGFRKLSDGISLYLPTIQEQVESSTDPTLIILCTWAFAQPKHIAKYLTPYQSIYPAASILLVQNPIGNTLWRPDTWQHSFFRPATMVVHEQLSQLRYQRILMHIFSNGGSHAAVQLAQTYRKDYKGTKMRVDALVLDSAPGIPRIESSIKILTLGVPGNNPVVKATAVAFAYGSVGLVAALDRLNLAEPAPTKAYRLLNDPDDIFFQNGSQLIPRTYIFSKADQMVEAEDIVSHAQIAKRNLVKSGISVTESNQGIRLEETSGTAHVNHMKDDPDRYWKIVRETWSRTVKELI